MTNDAYQIDQKTIRFLIHLRFFFWAQLFEGRLALNPGLNF